jgi:hypothetical protein
MVSMAETAQRLMLSQSKINLLDFLKISKDLSPLKSPEWLTQGGGSSGSGEVRLLRLDDVDVSSLSAGKSLRYNANTAKLEFFTPFDPQLWRHNTCCQ